MSANQQQRDPGRTGEQPARRDGGPEPDVLLDVPRVSVDELRLAVDGLDADLSLRARLANLLQIDAGVRVHLQGVELDMNGVHAEALLKVRLEKLVEILGQALSTLERNPQILDGLSRTVSSSIDDVNRAAQQVATGGQQLLGSAGQQLGGLTGQVGQQAGGAAGQVARQAAGAAGQVGQQAAGAAGQVGQQAGGAAGQVGQQAAGAAGRQGQQQPGDGAQPGGGGQPRGAAGGQPGGESQRAGQGGPGGPGGPEGRRQGAGVGRAEGEPEAQAQRGQPEAEAGERREAAGGFPAAGAVQFAEQASEALRQAGRSVWEVIQGGMGQRREQGR